MSKVSVIIPCYNAEKHITRCLEALFQQTFYDFEIIIVDDCSKDNSAQVIDTIINNNPEKLIRLVSNKKNCGPGKSRNEGIKHASGEYISFCDADDWYEPMYLEMMLNEANRNHADIVFCGYNQIIGNNGHIIRHEAHYERGLCKEKQLLFDVDSLCRIMVKREIAYNNPIPELWNAEDMAAIPLWISTATSYGVVNECIYNYFCHVDSVSNAISERAIVSAQKSYKLIIDNLSGKYADEAEFLAIRNYLYGAILGLYKYSCDNSKAEMLLDEFECICPNWINNKYYFLLPLYKRFFVYAVSKRWFWLIKVMTRLHIKLHK